MFVKRLRINQVFVSILGKCFVEIKSETVCFTPMYQLT